MSRYVIGFTLFILFLLSTSQIFAHGTYQPFITINGAYTKHNPLTPASVEGFTLTHDVAPKPYQVFEQLNFQIDFQKLNRQMDWEQFMWDFGDGNTSDTVWPSHRYEKIGTFVVSLYYEQGETKELITSITLHIVPLKNYKLPSPVISINGKRPADTQNPTIYTRFNTPFQIDGSLSQSKSATISSYFWDLGDGTFETKSQLTHIFANNNYNTRVILRVTDVNGFYSDTLVTIINADEPLPRTTRKTGNTMKWIGISAIICFGLISILLVIYKRLKSRWKR